MIATDNRTAILRLYEEAWNRGALEVLDEIVSPDFLSHDYFPEREVRGIQGLRELITAYRGAFPDLEIRVERQLDLDPLSQVVCLVTFSGTFSGPLMGLPPTGDRLEATWIDTFRVVDGRLQEEWICVGNHTSARQVTGCVELDA